MSTQHTPGPWQAEYDDNGFYYIHAEDQPSPYIVATANEGSIDEANAKLIGAAPDLLKALQEIVAYEDRCRANSNPMIAEKFYRIAKKAIEKAASE